MNKITSVCKTLFGTAIKKYPLFFILEFIKTINSVGMPFLGIYFTPLIVDEICTDRDLKRLITLALTFIILEFILNTLQEAIGCQLNKYQTRLNDYFTRQIGIHSMNLDFQLTENKEALDQLDRARTGMTWYSGGVYGIAEQIFMFFGNVFKIVGFTTVIIMNAPWMLVAIAGYVAVNTLVSAKDNKIELDCYGKLSKINRLFGYFAWTMVDFRFGKDIRLYEAKDMFINRWRDNSLKSNEIWKNQGDLGFKYRKYSVFAKTISTMFLYLYTGILVISAKLTIGLFTQTIEASGALDATINGLVWNIQEIIKRCNYAYEYVLFMNYPEAIEKHHDNVDKELHTIEFKHVSFAYPNSDKKVLEDVNIVIKPGEKLSIVGLNGAGKTTFIKLLCRLYDPTSGEILLDGKNIKEYDYKEYMKQFAPVFQDFRLFGFAISENVLLEDIDNQSEEDRTKLLEMLKLVEVDGLINKNEKGIDTTIFTVFDDKGIEPSGGEQQKLAIARALYKDAPVIILDEPTAALDPVAEYEIYKQFHTLVGDKTAIYISHRLSSCRFCDRIAVFSDGKITEYGNHESLVNLVNGVYAKMFEAQAQYYR